MITRLSICGWSTWGGNNEHASWAERVWSLGLDMLGQWGIDVPEYPTAFAGTSHAEWVAFRIDGIDASRKPLIALMMIDEDGAPDGHSAVRSVEFHRG